MPVNCSFESCTIRVEFARKWNRAWALSPPPLLQINTRWVLTPVGQRSQVNKGASEKEFLKSIQGVFAHADLAYPIEMDYREWPLAYGGFVATHLKLELWVPLRDHDMVGAISKVLPVIEANIDKLFAVEKVPA